MSAPVLVATADRIGTITLNRADKRNALDTATIDGVRIALAELELESAVRVIVLRGDGPDFCAGADLTTVEDDQFVSTLRRVLTALLRAPFPTIAGVEGAAARDVTDLAELLDHCRARLASHQCPIAIDVKEQLPRTASGKLVKRHLRTPFWTH